MQAEAPPSARMPAAEDNRQIYPNNTRLLGWNVSAEVRWLDPAGHVVRGVRRSVERYWQVEAAAPLATGEYTLAEASQSPEYAGEKYVFKIDGPSDTTAPKLVQVSVPSEHYYPKGLCPAAINTTFKVRVEDWRGLDFVDSSHYAASRRDCNFNSNSIGLS